MKDIKEIYQRKGSVPEDRSSDTETSLLIVEDNSEDRTLSLKIAI